MKMDGDSRMNLNKLNMNFICTGKKLEQERSQKLERKEELEINWKVREEKERQERGEKRRKKKADTV